MGNVPKLRFSQFSGEWEEKKLGELTKINQGLQIAISERYTAKVKDSHFYITNEFLKKGSSKKYFIKEPSPSVICNEDDILMTRTGNTGQVVTNVNGAFHNNFFKINYFQNFDKNFLVYFLRIKNTQNMILRYAGTSTIPDLNHGDFYRLKIDLPSLKEQEKIASFLSAVDKKIEKLEEKIALQEKYKKAMMQKLFSQEIRFKADDGSDFPAWKISLFNDILFIIDGDRGTNYPNSSEFFGNGYCLFLNAKNVTKNGFRFNECNFITKEKDNLLSKGKLECNDIVLTTRGTVGNFALYDETVNFQNLRINSGMVILRTKDNRNYNNYLYKFFDSFYMKKQIKRTVFGSAQPQLTVKTIRKFNILLPPKQEQQKIANFLSSLDKKIEATKKQKQKANEFKKGLLQQMFV